MNFVSIAFFVFFAVILLSQVLVKQTKARQLILLAASYFFYGWWDWRFCFLMLLVTAIAHVSALRISVGKNRKAWLAVGIVAPLAVLFSLSTSTFSSIASLLLLASRASARLLSSCRLASRSTRSKASATRSTYIAIEFKLARNSISSRFMFRSSPSLSPARSSKPPSSCTNSRKTAIPPNREWQTVWSFSSGACSRRPF